MRRGLRREDRLHHAVVRPRSGSAAIPGAIVASSACARSRGRGREGFPKLPDGRLYDGYRVRPYRARGHCGDHGSPCAVIAEPRRLSAPSDPQLRVVHGVGQHSGRRIGAPLAGRSRLLDARGRSAWPGWCYAGCSAVLRALRPGCLARHGDRNGHAADRFVKPAEWSCTASATPSTEPPVTSQSSLRG